MTHYGEGPAGETLHKGEKGSCPAPSCGPPPEVGIFQLLELVPGLTKRQADHWTRNGWLEAEMRPRREGGRGERFWPRQEAMVARVMLRLTRAGLFAEVAAALARGVVQQDRGRGEDVTVALGPKLALVVGFDIEESRDRPDGWTNTAEFDTLLSRL